jgi:hypothetical protein
MFTTKVAAAVRSAALFSLLVTGLIAVAPLQAQNRDRDVQALLANDDAVADLR